MLNLSEIAKKSLRKDTFLTHTVHSFVTLKNVRNFQNSFSVVFSIEFATKLVSQFPSQLKFIT